MSILVWGIVLGTIYGAFSAASMIPLEFEDKRTALTGAFLNRLAIGVALGAMIGSPQLSQFRPWMVGVTIGLLLSASDAVITKAYVPVLLLGGIGGGVLAIVLDQLSR